MQRSLENDRSAVRTEPCNHRGVRQSRRVIRQSGRPPGGHQACYIEQVFDDYVRCPNGSVDSHRDPIL